jgi:hypothetical protein
MHQGYHRAAEVEGGVQVTKTAKVRLGLLWFSLTLIEVLLVMFVGIGYFLLVFAIFKAVSSAAPYSDSIYIAFCGREQHAAKAHELAKFRTSNWGKITKILGVVTSVCFFALAIFAILKVNFKFIDFF